MPVLDLMRHELDVMFSRTLPEAQARRCQAILLKDVGDSCLVGLVDLSQLG